MEFVGLPLQNGQGAAYIHLPFTIYHLLADYTFAQGGVKQETPALRLVVEKPRAAVLDFEQL